jgi:hypothetical protein
MQSNSEFLQRQLADIARGRSSSSEGIVIAQDWDNRLVTINVGGTEYTLKWSGDAPWPGDTVRLVLNGGTVHCEAVWGAPLGTVDSVTSGIALVVGDDSRDYAYVDTVGVSAGNRVRLDHAGRSVVAVLPVEPEDSEYVVPAPPPPPSGTTGGEQWFNPAWSGNWRPGFSGSAVEISSTRMGMYGYGTQIRDTIPDSATISLAQLHLVQNWDNVPGVASSMGTHGYNGAPSSADNTALSGSYSVPGGTRVVDIAGAVADALKTGAALGVGFRSGSSGWRQYAVAPGYGRILIRWS